MSKRSGPRVSWLAVVLSAVLAGCAAPSFTEVDLGQTKEVSLGSVFTVSLSPPGEWRSPKVKGVVVSFLNQHRVEPDGKTVFEFKAELEGETEIVIPAKPDWGHDRDFSMRIKVPQSSYSDDVDWDEDRFERHRHLDRD